MTTITIKKDISGLPQEFEDWEQLQDFVLDKLRVKISPLQEDEVTDDLLERINKSREKFKKAPETFDNI